MPATILRERSIHAEIEVGRPDGETWVPIKDYVSSITVELGDVSAIGTGQSGVDGVVRRLNFSIHNDRSLPVRVWPKDGTVPRSRTLNEADTVPAAGTNSEWLIRLLGQTPSIKGESFAPRDRTSGWNYLEGEYEPLLWPTREVVFRAATKEVGESPGPNDWVTLFHGIMGDSIQSDGGIINCSLRDYSKILQDHFVEKDYNNPKIYGSESGTPVEDELQRLIDDELGPGVVTLYFPSGTPSNPRPISESPGFMLKPYEVGEKSLWDELQTIVASFGWFIGYRWHEPTQNMQLVLMEPPRDKHSGTADFHFTASEIYIHDLDITDRDVRNSVSVDWRDPITGQLKTVTVEDQDSIDRFGRRHMHIGESDSIVFKTEEEALRLANAALHDLKDLTGVVRLTLPFMPELDVFAGITVSDPRISSTVDFYGVESVRHILDFDNGQFRTEAVCSTRVVGGKRKWLRMQTRPGHKPSIPPESVGSGSATMPAPTGIEWESIPGGITIYVPKPPVHALRWSLTEVHISDTNGFVPDDTTLVASNRATEFTIAPLEGGQTVYIRAAYVDVDGRRYAFSEQVQGETGEVEPIDLTPPATPTGLVAIPVVGGFVLSWNRHVPPPPLDRWILQRASSEDDYATWQTVNDEIRSALYTDVDALSYDYQYKYRLIAVSRAGIESLPSDETEPSTPGKVSLAEDVVDQLKREYLDQDFVSEVQDMQSRLGQAESELQEAQNRLSGAEQRLDDAEGRLANAETQLAEAENRLGTAEQRLTTAEAQLVDARSRLTDAEERLDEAEQALEQVEGVVQEHTATLETHAQEIAARVTQQVFDSLEQRVTDAEAELLIHAQEIQARVEQTVFDALKSTVESHTATLQVHAQEIAARVTQEVFDILEATVSQHEATLQIHADAIAAKVEQTVFDALANRVSQAEAELAVHADEIQARVKQEDFDVLEDRVTQAESTLTIHADQIATKVEQSVVDTLEGRVSQAETAIQQKADKIELTALSQEVDTIEQRVTTAETTLTQKADKIELNAVSEEVDALGQRVTSAETTLTQKADKIELNAVREDLDQLSGTVATHEATLQTHAQQIAARVTQEVFNALEGRVTEAESELSILADEIQARVEKTVFDTLAQTVAEHSATLDIHADEIAARVKQTVFDVLEQRVTDAETTLQAHAGEIAARVTQTTFDDLKRVVDSGSRTKPQGGILFPFDTTLFGTGGIKPLDGYVATLRPGEGRFGGAVAVEEARENALFTLGGGYVSWLANLSEGQSSDRSVGGGIVRVTRLGEHRFRAEVIQDITGVSAISLIRTSFAWPANQPHVISAYIRDYYEAPGTNGAWGLGRTSSGGPHLNGRNGLGRKVHLYSPTSSDITTNFGLRAAGNSLVTAGSYIEWEFAQAELNASFATSFVDGTRARGRLEYPQSIWNHATGTFAAWVKTPTDVTTDRVLTLQWASDQVGADTRFGIRMNTRGRFVVSYGSADTLTTADSYNDGEWHHVVLTWVDGTADIHLYVDGERVASASEPISVRNPGGRYRGVIPIGHRGYTYNDQWWNGLIDELLILPYAASEEEIRAWYETQAPFYDPDDVAYTAGRVEQHEATLQIHAGQIASKVERTEFDQLSGRVTQAETAIQQKADQVVVTAIDNRLQTAEQNISGLVVTAQEISTAVANVQDGLTQAQSAIQQNANQIALRVQAINQETGEPVQAALQVVVQDGEPYVLLDGRKVLLPGTLVADDIQSGTLRLTGDMEIVGPEGGWQGTPSGIVVRDASNTDRIALGKLDGRPWGKITLPSGSYGVWGDDARLFLKQYPRFYGIGTAEFNIEIPQGRAGDTIIGTTDTVEFVDYHGNPFPSITLVNGRTLHGHVSLQSVESWDGDEYVMIQILNYSFRATVDGVPDQFILFSGPRQFEKLALRIRYMMYYVKDQPSNQVPRGVRVVVSGVFLEEESTPSSIVYPL